MEKHTKRQVKDNFKKDAFISDVCHRCLCVISDQTEKAKEKEYFLYYAQKMLLLCLKRPTIMLKNFPPDHYIKVPDSQLPHVATSVSCGEVWGSRLSRIFLHRKSGIPMYSFIHVIYISENFFYCCAGVMLDAHASLLCSKLCRHNVDNP